MICSQCGRSANFICSVCREAFCDKRGCSLSGAHHPCEEVYRTIVGPVEDKERPKFGTGFVPDPLSNRDLRNKIR